MVRLQRAVGGAGVVERVRTEAAAQPPAPHARRHNPNRDSPDENTPSSHHSYRVHRVVVRSRCRPPGRRNSPPAGKTEPDKHHDEVKLTAEAIARFNIKLGTAEERALTPTFAAPARVAFNAEAVAHVGAAVRGRATEIKARIGDSVKKGDELISVESPELGQAQSDLLQKANGRRGRKGGGRASPQSIRAGQGAVRQERGNRSGGSAEA